MRIIHFTKCVKVNFGVVCCTFSKSSKTGGGNGDGIKVTWQTIKCSCDEQVIQYQGLQLANLDVITDVYRYMYVQKPYCRPSFS